MGDEKKHVEVEEIKVNDAFDEKYKKSMPKVMQEAIEKAVDKSRTLTTGKGADGFVVLGSVSSLTMDEKGTLAAKVSLVLATSKKAILGNATGKSSIKTDPENPDKDVARLLEGMCGQLAAKQVVPALEEIAAEK